MILNILTVGDTFKMDHASQLLYKLKSQKTDIIHFVSLCEYTYIYFKVAVVLVRITVEC